jgi:TolB-like protein
MWQRVHHHKLVQWSVAYVALAYAIQHAIILTSESFEWPNAVARISMLLFVLGLPLVLTFAWYHGARASRNFSQAELSIVTALLVVGSLVFYVFVRPETQLRSPAAQEASVTAARQEAASPKGAISVAVLPFVNLSSDKEQEFFSDGMTEEITTALAKVPDLRVVARTSAFEFKGKNVEVQSIGQQLHASHLIEGSVRKAGNRVRITAQLIKADDGTHVWAEDYDRDLTDVFAIQEDIARAIATSLRMPLGLKAGEQLIKQRKIDPELHERYLRARNLVRTRLIAPTAEAIRLLNEVVSRAPGYAPAWAALAQAHTGALIVDPDILSGGNEKARGVVQDHMQKTEAAANQAIKLDPDTAEAYCALASVRRSQRDQLSSWNMQERGLAIDPDSPECLQTTNELAHLGFVKEALAYREHLVAVEPFVPAYRQVQARELFAGGQYGAALAILQNMSGGGFGGRGLLAQIYAAQGRYADAADVLVAIRDPAYTKWTQTAAALLRKAPAAAPSNERPELGVLDWVYMYVGAPERFMNMYENGLRTGYLGGVTNALQWAPAYRSIRQTPRFKQYMRDAGIVAYWRAKGWPPQCHPTTGDDFECG